MHCFLLIPTNTITTANNDNDGRQRNHKINGNSKKKSLTESYASSSEVHSIIFAHLVSSRFHYSNSYINHIDQRQRRLSGQIIDTECTKLCNQPIKRNKTDGKTSGREWINLISHETYKFSASSHSSYFSSSSS